MVPGEVRLDEGGSGMKVLTAVLAVLCFAAGVACGALCRPSEGVRPDDSVELVRELDGLECRLRVVEASRRELLCRAERVADAYAVRYAGTAAALLPRAARRTGGQEVGRGR